MDLTLDKCGRLRALALLEQAIEVVCATSCPPTWGRRTTRPHLALCREAREFLAAEMSRDIAARIAQASEKRLGEK